MREILDEFIETIAQMWERSDDPEVELIDIALIGKAALLAVEGENYLREDPIELFKLLSSFGRPRTHVPRKAKETRLTKRFFKTKG